MTNERRWQDPRNGARCEKTAAKRPILNASLRGARFGGLVAGIVMSVVGILCLAFSLLTRMPTMPSLLDVAGMLAAVGLSALYGSVIGAAIMGVHAVVRRRG